ncbi:cobalamin-binding protein [Asanoa ishikariensis]|uniref:Iron complex transport system substrate-binding protein n=1 Tax=Asanoa ishikariensis TaxID=137265 RepID=A0A1H3MAW4_9ACTN|nr:ABC transporter substrate-binding protein [Asanoa ishikariensis]GIF66002.1 cobalamin-binding protein [Asanoa ishikariensis]SDY73428.1 iron complex transport system substrate-binding protein [Asanoa ishikariensis]
MEGRLTLRLVSLLPSATEIVYALGVGDDLVGVTFECTIPAGFSPAIVVGGRDTRDLTPGEIDAYVRSAAATGADLYTLHADALADLRPDLILTQDLCRVCALPSGRVTDALAHLGCQSDVLTLDPHTLAEVLDSINAVGDRAFAAAAAATLVTSLRARLSAVATAVVERPRPRVAVVEWTDPPFGAGHWIPDLVAAAGGTPVVAHPGARSAATTWAAFQEADPDVVVVAPCGYDVIGAAAQARTVLPHFPSTPVWAIDADALIVRPGPRLVDGVEALAAILHPDAVEQPPPGQITRVA